MQRASAFARPLARLRMRLGGSSGNAVPPALVESIIFSPSIAALRSHGLRSGREDGPVRLPIDVGSARFSVSIVAGEQRDPTRFHPETIETIFAGPARPS